MNAAGIIAAAIALTMGAAGCPGQTGVEAPAKKRAAPPPPPGVTAGGVRYQAIARGLEYDDAERGGYVAAIDTATGRELWRVRVYAMRDDPDMERDKTDVFIARLALADHRRALVATDERGGRYRIDLTTRAVTRLR